MIIMHLNKTFDTSQHVEKSGGEAEALLPVKPAEATVPVLQRWRLRDRVLGGRSGTREDRGVIDIHTPVRKIIFCMKEILMCISMLVIAMILQIKVCIVLISYIIVS